MGTQVVDFTGFVFFHQGFEVDDDDDDDDDDEGDGDGDCNGDAGKPSNPKGIPRFCVHPPRTFQQASPRGCSWNGPVASGRCTP